MSADAVNLLLVERDTGMEHVFRELLPPSFAIETAGTLDEALDYLVRRGADVVLMNPELPDSLGLEALRDVFAAAPHTPVIALVEEETSEIVQAVLERHAGDFLSKADLSRRTVLRSLRYAAELRRLQNEVRQQSELRGRVLDNLADIVEVTDADGKLLYVNRAFEVGYGYSRKEVMGRTPAQLLRSSEHDEAYYQHMWATVTSGQVWTGRLVSKRRDGSLRDQHATVSPVFDVSGELTNLVAVKRDMTEHRKQIEVRRRLERAVEQSSDGIAVIDNDGYVVFANQAWVAMHGYAPEDAGPLIGEHVRVFHPADEYERITAPFSDQIAAFGSHQAEVQHRRKDGSTFPAWLTLTSLHDDEQREVGVVAIARDIREQKAAQDLMESQAVELRRSNAELEHFAYLASHDLQEPLRTVSSFAELLVLECGGRLGERAEEYLQHASDAARRMKRLIDDLLAYSRAAVQGEEPKKVDCADALGEALRNLERAIEESGALVTATELPTVTGIRTQLVQVFQNLVGNAVKFSGDESPRVHITAEREGESMVIAVEDSGVGIDPRHHTRIFDVFKQLRPEAPAQGTGIGLAICKQVVERHGGRIWVESTVGQGARFCFTLPV